MEFYIGQIIMFGGNFGIRGFALAQGQLLPINQNTALFSILGTTYGGDGRTTFGLPDLRGRAPIGSGHGPGLQDYRLGVKGGVENVTLNWTQMPSHTHLASGIAHIGVTSSPGDTDDPAGSIPAQAANDNYLDGGSPTSQWSGTSEVTVQNTGGNQAHTNLSPFLAINYEVALVGIFPSRN